ncbi:MAG TPA: transglycosylase domain-containing protein [Myxococcota bacterium]|nr:transglycosylase domain-containing protein [Myxococcota bacterium]HON24567.1 transglycosylase domain-containing protein [Myxococcota bacterium]HOS61358.1 transglycosylase domain-containing protein [Myxococcota bacterium]HPC90868.1 transglycosylase domain-containing protein [Myxococcota bacterium]HPL24530.1 transglycosylase domain-containing protein [Myxococcota bacterium]
MSKLEITNPRGRSWPLVVIRLVFVCMIAGGLAVASLLGGAYVWLARDLPLIPPYDAIRFETVSQVRAAHGQILSEVYSQRRYMVPVEDMPPLVVNAFLASEDERFFNHSGTDLRAILRAAYVNIRSGRVKEGASTITQQTARTLLLSSERKMARKVREAIVARRIEDIYTKDQILTLYLNMLFLGNNSYGVQAASRAYFGKELHELDAAEAAALAVLPQSPGSVTPVSKPDVVESRRNHVLRRMHLKGILSEEDLNAALAKKVQAVRPKNNLRERAPIPATKAMQAIAPLAKKSSSVPVLAGEGGLTATTTIDLGLQLVAQEVARDAAVSLAKRQGYSGPIAHIEAPRWDEFLQRNQSFLAISDVSQLSLQDTVLALASSVDSGGVHIQVTPEIKGFIPLELMKWATKYTEFPKKNKDRARTSLDGKLKSAADAVTAGDVLLVRLADPNRPKPKSKKRGAKTAANDVAPGSPEFQLEVFPGPQVAIASVEPKSGRIVALVGGSDFDISQVNRTESIRQTGSVIKPLYYSKAYDMGVAPSTVLAGTPYREGEWAPTGDKDDTKDMTLYEALTRSENRISLRVFKTVMDSIGISGLNDWLRGLGFNQTLGGYTPEALGADASPMEMLTAFATFHNKGIAVKPVLIREIRDSTGTLVVDNRSSRDAATSLFDAISLETATQTEDALRVMTEETAFIITHNLRNVAERGTGRAAKKLSRPVYGKTGTLPFDVWFIGSTHELTTVTWLGQDLRERWLGRSKEKGRVFGADTALPAWMNFMAVATDGLPVVDDLEEVPEGVVIVNIDLETGLLASSGGTPMPHLVGTEPTEYATENDWLAIDEELADF